MVREVTELDRKKYNSVVTHPLQSWEWGEFREKTGVRVVRLGEFDGKKLVGGVQMTIHSIPHTNYTIGYIPKSIEPTAEVLTELGAIGKKNKCIFVKLEPNLEVQSAKFKVQNYNAKLKAYKLLPSAHPLFTKYTFEIDLTKSEEELMKEMSSKTRYNVRLAQKRGVVVGEDSSPEAFNRYIELTMETTKRQGFYAHDEKYHRTMWETLRSEKVESGKWRGENLSAHLLTAKFEGKILVTWVVFLFNNVLYYPYGASSNEHRDVMASNLMMWEAMKWGKSRGAKSFDLWGALGPDPDPKDPWYGSHRFKEGYGARHVEFMGSYDLVLNPLLYSIYNILHRLRWLVLRFKK